MLICIYINFNQILYHIQILTQKWITDINIKYKAIKPRKQSVRKTFCVLFRPKFLR